MIPGYDAGRVTGDDKRRAAEKKRLSESVLFRYRPYYVSGQMELRTVAELIADDLGVTDTGERQKIASRLSYFAKAHNWKQLREHYAETLSAAVEARLVEETADEYLEKLRRVGDAALMQGHHYLAQMAPFDVPQALQMIEVGAKLGLRARNLPEKVSQVGVSREGATNIDRAVIIQAQQLSPRDYEALALASDAAFAELAPGRAITAGREVQGAAHPEQGSPEEG